MTTEDKTVISLFRAAPWWQKVLFVATTLAALGYTLWITDLRNRPSQGYDEEMWTGASISTYNMLFKGYVRPTKKLDNWFPTYAYKNGVDVFVDKLGENRAGGRVFPYNRLAYFEPDTLRFPWDFIQWDTLGQPMSFAVMYDTLKFPRQRFQWVDNALWTFGWKAPNVGKALMGLSVELFSKEKPDPYGYFEYRDPEGTPTNVTFNYVPHGYLEKARIPNALLTAGTVKLVFLLGWLWLGFWPGFLAALYLLLNKFFMHSSSAVGLDGTSIFFMMAALAGLQSIFGVLKNQSWRPFLLWSAFTGVLFGLGVGSKLNDALFAYIALLLLGLLFLLHLGKIRMHKVIIARLAVAGVLIMALGGGVFLLFNPLYRDQPLAMMRTTRQSVDGYFTRRAKDQRTKFTPARGREFIYGYAGPGTQYAVTDTIRQGESIALAEGTRVGSWQVAQHKKKQSYVNTKELRPYIEVVQGNASAQWRLMAKRNLVVVEPDRYYATLGHWLSFKGNPADGLFLFIGLTLLVLAGLKKLFREKKVTPPLLLVLAFAVIFIGTTDFIWIDFSRYHIVLYPTMSMIVAYGIVNAVRWLQRWWHRKKGTVTPKATPRKTS